VSIAQQIATPTPKSKARRPSAPLQPVPAPRRAYALGRIFVLVAITALGTALLAGTVAVGLMMLASNLGG
jgi:hypothetical protein